MKNIIYFIFLALIINSCNKEKSEPKPFRQTTITQSISSKGGSLELMSAKGDSVILIIPNGALKNEENISMKITEGFTSESIKNIVFPEIELGPDNLIFEQPLTLIIEFAEPQEDINMVTIFNVGNAIKLLKTENITSRRIQAELLHFSPYSAGIPTYDEIMQLLMENIVYQGSIDARENLEIIDDIYNLYRYAELLDILGRSDKANEVRESAKGFLEEKIMIVMNDLPEDPCSGGFMTTYIHLGRVAAHYLGTHDLVKELNSSIGNIKNQCLGPKILTTFSTNYEDTRAFAGGEVTEDWEEPVTERGVYLDDLKLPNGEGLGTFQAELFDLIPNTTYKVKAYASNRFGTSYGEEIRFVVDIDGNIYLVVSIGLQDWITENLKTTRYNDGESIKHVTDREEWSNLPGTDYSQDYGYYCYYDNKISNKYIYGAIYNYPTIGSGKLCPTGWHVPSMDEYLVLVEYAGGADIAGGKLKAPGTTYWKYPNTGATNEYGLTALPGGWRRGMDMIMEDQGDFVGIGEVGAWFTSTLLDYSLSHYYVVVLSYNYEEAEMLYAPSSNYGTCVLCVMDQE